MGWQRNVVDTAILESQRELTELRKLLQASLKAQDEQIRLLRKLAGEQ